MSCQPHLTVTPRPRLPGCPRACGSVPLCQATRSMAGASSPIASAMKWPPFCPCRASRALDTTKEREDEVLRHRERATQQRGRAGGPRAHRPRPPLSPGPPSTPKMAAPAPPAQGGRRVAMAASPSQPAEGGAPFAWRLRQPIGAQPGERRALREEREGGGEALGPGCDWEIGLTGPRLCSSALLGKRVRLLRANVQHC